jgi:hypothetical protein
MGNKLFGTVVVLFIIAMIVSASLKLISGYIIFGIVVMLGMYSLFFSYLKVSYAREKLADEESKKEKKKFSYCWDRINQLLSIEMPGGETMDWDKGDGVRFVTKDFHSGGEKSTFMGVIAKCTNTYQIVNIIYNVDRDNIVEFLFSPGSDRINDPLYEFKPFENSAMGMGMGMYNPMYNSRNRSRYNRMPQGYGGMPMMDMGQPMEQPQDQGSYTTPTSAEIDNAVKKLNK